MHEAYSPLTLPRRPGTLWAAMLATWLAGPAAPAAASGARGAAGVSEGAAAAPPPGRVPAAAAARRRPLHPGTAAPHSLACCT